MPRRQTQGSEANRRRRQQRRARRQQRQAQEGLDGLYEHQDRDDDGEAHGSVDYGDLPPWPAIEPPFYYVQPPPYTTYTETLFPYGEDGSLIDEQGNIFDPVYSTWLGDDEVDPWDEFLQHGNTDVLQELGYAPYLPHAPFLGEAEQAEENSNGDQRTAAGDTMPKESAESWGDAHPYAVGAIRGLRSGLQDVYYGPVVTMGGTVSVMLRHGIRVDISVERAVRVVNFDKECMAAVDSSGDRSCVCHPCGRVLQQGVAVDVATGSRLAKISSRGVVFTAHNHGLTYVVDASGTKSTIDRFKDLCYDIPLSIFYSSSNEEDERFNECFRIVSLAKQWNNQNGDEVWLVGGVRIKQAPWGDVQVSRHWGRLVISTSPTEGTMSVVTPLIKAVVTCDPRRFFFVRMNQKRLSADADGFAVRNGSQRAGFDSLGRLVLL